MFNDIDFKNVKIGAYVLIGLAMLVIAGFFIGAPFLMIMAINALFPSAAIALSFSTWSAMYMIMVMYVVLSKLASSL